MKKLFIIVAAIGLMYSCVGNTKKCGKRLLWNLPKL